MRAKFSTCAAVAGLLATAACTSPSAPVKAGASTTSIPAVDTMPATVQGDTTGRGGGYLGSGT
jgi:hypothetical protein